MAKSIAGRALRSDGNGSLAWSGPRAEFVKRTAEKDASAEPSTKHDIEAVRFCAFASPGSPRDRLGVMISPSTTNNSD